ncbi:hypothetical protein [Planococcus faecalis]|uniref:Uncharacterized protein n=1 Tax=Planococcus faecalis TaxID=1598147 RepID=A0ABM6IPR4_9BACL|nr:hypothetical protein [Planococcus faecalis]AQU78577.1 hypothetical protein AJGP001_04365 [Planococcus faecalis]OHX53235.1 hypothetical protein BB777_10695 [Planococcus faecalis]
MTKIHKQKFWRFAALPWLLLTIAALLATGGWLLKADSQDATNVKNALQEISIDQTGATSNMNKKRISNLSVSHSSTGWNVEISINADKELTVISTKQKMLTQTIAILDSLPEIDQLEDMSFSWLYPIVNEQNEVDYQSVLSFRLDKKTREQLIWDNVTPSILPDLVIDYEERLLLE